MNRVAEAQTEGALPLVGGHDEDSRVPGVGEGRG